MSETTEAERAWLREQLHSPKMQCRQCEVTRRLLSETEPEGEQQ